MPVIIDDSTAALAGPPRSCAEQRDGDLDELVAAAGLLQHRAEQHEQEDHRGRHPERNAEDAFGLHPVVPHRLFRTTHPPLVTSGIHSRMAPKKARQRNSEATMTSGRPSER